MEINITYKREMKHNYLIIEPLDEFRLGYECKMLLCNSIDGLLKFHLKQLDGKLQYYYEITSRQPLSRLLEKQCITSEEIRLLLVHISQTLNQMESYLLKEEQIILDPDYIYVDSDSFFVSLCLIPGRTCSFPDDLSKLLQYILSKVNHQDKNSVVLAYSLFQESQKENYGIEDLLKLLTGEKQICKKTEEELECATEFPGNQNIDYRRNEAEIEKINIHKRRQPEKYSTVSEDLKESEDRKDYLKNRLQDVKGIRSTQDKRGTQDIRRNQVREDAKVRKDIKNKKTIKNERNDRNTADDRNTKKSSYTKGGIKPGKIKHGSCQNQAEMQSDNLEDSQNSIKAKKNGELSVLLIMLMILLPSGVWFLYGNQGIYMFLPYMIGGEIILAAMLLAALAGLIAHKGGIIKKSERTYGREPTQETWQMMFEDDLEEYEADIKTEEDTNLNLSEGTECRGSNTVLLADLEIYKNTHRLISLDGSGQEIVLSYFPFIIGKQEGIADYVLAKETISRLHARIDEEEGIFRITDLNSTNGTKVGDKLLENNESAFMSPGQEIYLADQGFRFV